jgi:hypothetical protein
MQPRKFTETLGAISAQEDVVVRHGLGTSAVIAQFFHLPAGETAWPPPAWLAILNPGELHVAFGVDAGPGEIAAVVVA